MALVIHNNLNEMNYVKDVSKQTNLNHVGIRLHDDSTASIRKQGKRLSLNYVSNRRS